MKCHETLLARKKRSQEKRTRHTLHQRDDYDSRSGHNRGQSHSHGHSSRPNLPTNNSGSSMNRFKASPSFSNKSFDKSLPSIPTEEKTSSNNSSTPDTQINIMESSRNESSSRHSSRLAAPASNKNTNRNSVNFSSLQTSDFGSNDNINNSNSSLSNGSTVLMTESYHERNDSDSSKLGFLPIRLDESSVPITLEAEPEPEQQSSHRELGLEPNRPSERASSYFEGLAPPRPTSVLSNISNRSFTINEKAEPKASDSRPSTPMSDKSLGAPADLDERRDSDSNQTVNSNSTSSSSIEAFNRTPSGYGSSRDIKNMPQPLNLEAEPAEKLIPQRSALRSTSPMRPAVAAATNAANAAAAAATAATAAANGANTNGTQNPATTPGELPTTPNQSSPDPNRGAKDLKRSSPISRSSKSSPRSPRLRSPPQQYDSSRFESSGPVISLPNLTSSSALSLSDDLTPFLSQEQYSNSDVNEVEALEQPQAHKTGRERYEHDHSHRDSNGQSHGNQDIDKELHSQHDDEVADENSKLTRELFESKKRIADLEQQLTRRRKDRALEEDLQEKRKTIAGLQAQQEVSKKELEALNVESEKLESDEIVKKFRDEVEGYKKSIMEEISDLIQQRDSLKEEVVDLTEKRDFILKESSILNVKNTQLADMNNELTKQMIDKFGNGQNPPSHHHATAAAPSSNKLPSSGSMSNLDSYTSTNSPAINGQQHYGGSQANTSGNSDQNTMSTSHSGPIHSFGDPMVTVLEAGQVVDTRKDRQHARRFWKRPGAAVAKGLNKVFATDETNSPHLINIGGSNSTNGNNSTNSNAQNGNTSSGNTTNNSNATPNSLTNSVTDLTQENGLGISLPKDQKKNRGNWFKSNNSNEHSAKDDKEREKEKQLGPDALMGAPLESRVVYEGTTVPVLVSKCIEEVEKRGIDFEGLYRKSGGKSQITEIAEVFEKCQETRYDEVLAGDIAGVTSALKQYLRYLPIPLITYEVYDEFIGATEGAKDDVKPKIDRLKTVVHKLPAAHRETLEILMKHLSRVTQYSDTNLMTTKNLAVVFAPTLARDTTGEREILDMQPRNNGTQMLIEHCDSIFNIPSH